MRRLCGRRLHLAVLIAVLLAAPAVCEERDGEGQEAAAEQSALSRYGTDVNNRVLMAYNSVLTAPADPVMGAIEPLEEFEALPGGRVTRYVAGFGQGILLGVYRAVAGALDLVFAPSRATCSSWASSTKGTEGGPRAGVGPRGAPVPGAARRRFRRDLPAGRIPVHAVRADGRRPGDARPSAAGAPTHEVGEREDDPRNLGPQRGGKG
jgi:hypothetical protein